jgi:hypothetical protein
MKRMFFAVVLLLCASLVQAAGLEILTPPLIGTNGQCMVTNISDGPVNVATEILDVQGNSLGRAGAPNLPSLWTTRIGIPSGPSSGSVHVCRVTSDDGNKGDLKVTFCVFSVDSGGGCQGTVTAE